MGRAWLVVLFISFGGCTDTNDPGPVFPTLVFPGTITVTEGGSSTFLLRLDPAPTSNVGGVVTTVSGDLTTGDAATIMPSNFYMSPTNYPAIMTVHGVDDSQPNPGGERRTSIKGVIHNDSTMQLGEADVHIIDIQSQNVIASNWNITMAPSSSTAFGVQLTQPPTAPITVTLSFGTNQVIDVAPTSLAFGVADYNVLQPVMVTSHAAGTSAIELNPTNNITPRVVLVTVGP